jgi:hypothetical protein
MKEWIVLIGDEHASVAVVKCDEVTVSEKDGPPGIVTMYREGEPVAIWGLANIAGMMQKDANASVPIPGFRPVETFL